MEFVKEFSKCDISAVSTVLAKWILEFLGIRGVILTVNLDWEVLRIPNCDNPGSKKPKNFQKFQDNSQQDFIFL